MQSPESDLNPGFKIKEGENSYRLPKNVRKESPAGARSGTGTGQHRDPSDFGYLDGNSRSPAATIPNFPDNSRTMMK